MGDRGRPLSSEELIRRAREELRSNDPPDPGPAADTEEIDPEPSSGWLDPETDDAADSDSWRATETVDEDPAPASSETPRPWYENSPPPPDPERSDLPPPPPSQAADESPVYSPIEDDEDTTTWAPGPAESPFPTPDPVKKKPNFFVRLLVFRGWIVGAIALFAILGQCFASGGTVLDQLDIGDCFDEPGLAEEISVVEIIDCQELHDYEVYAIVNFGSSGRSFPGDDVLSDEASLECYNRFAGYVNNDWETSDFDFAWYYPTSGSWADGERSGLCAVYEYDPQTFEFTRSIGTARNAGR